MDEPAILASIAQNIRESTRDLEQANAKPHRMMPLLECFKVLQEAQQGVKDASRVYADPHGALDEAADLIGDALTDIQSVLTVDASRGCTCDQCAEKDITKDTML